MKLFLTIALISIFGTYLASLFFKITKACHVCNAEFPDLCICEKGHIGEGEL